MNKKEKGNLRSTEISSFPKKKLWTSSKRSMAYGSRFTSTPIMKILIQFMPILFMKKKLFARLCEIELPPEL